MEKQADFISQSVGWGSELIQAAKADPELCALLEVGGVWGKGKESSWRIKDVFGGTETFRLVYLTRAHLSRTMPPALPLG